MIKQFFIRLLKALISARERSAARYVEQYLGEHHIYESTKTR